MKPAIVTETATAIRNATGHDDRHTADVESLVGAAYAAGRAAGTTVENVAPLTDAEIATVRALLRAVPARKAAKRK